MKMVRVAVMIVLVACAGSVAPQAASQSGSSMALRVRLTAEKTYVAGRSVVLGFTLENLAAEPVWILKWYTPLEGIWGRIFRVTRDGTEVPYEGPMAKRGDPRLEDYVRIETGGSVSAKVDLARAYDLSLAGEYRVEFAGQVHDVAREGESLPRPRDAHRGTPVPGDGVTFRVVRQ